MTLYFDSSTLMEVTKVIEHEQAIQSVAANDSILVTCSGKVIRVFDQPSLTEKSYSPITTHKYHVIACLISPDGKFFVTTSMDGKASIIDPKTGTTLHTLRHPRNVGMRTCCMFDRHPGLLALGSTDGLILIYETTSFKLLKELNANNDESVNSVCFSPDNMLLLTVSSAEEFRIWDAAYLKDTPLKTVFSAHTDTILVVRVIEVHKQEKEGLTRYKFLTAGGDNLIKIWTIEMTIASDKPSHTLITSLVGHTAPIYSIDISKDKKYLLSCSGDSTFRIWNLETYELVYVQVDAHTKFINDCVFTPDMKGIITVSSDKQLKIWRFTDTFGLSASSPLNFPIYHTKTKVEEAKASDVEQPKPTDPSAWSVDEVADWLTKMGLMDMTTTFRSHDIDGSRLVEMTDNILRSQLLIESYGLRCKFLQAKATLLVDHSTLNGAIASVSALMLCPITHEPMRDPVIISDGYSYERSAIEAWFAEGKNSSPMTNAQLLNNEVLSNHTLRSVIQAIQSGRH